MMSAVPADRSVSRGHQTRGERDRASAFSSVGRCTNAFKRLRGTGRAVLVLDAISLAISALYLSSDCVDRIVSEVGRSGTAKAGDPRPGAPRARVRAYDVNGGRRFPLRRRSTR